MTVFKEAGLAVSGDKSETMLLRLPVHTSLAPPLVSLCCSFVATERLGPRSLHKYITMKIGQGCTKRVCCMYVCGRVEIFIINTRTFRYTACTGACIVRELVVSQTGRQANRRQNEYVHVQVSS